MTAVTQSAPVMRHHHDRLIEHVDRLPATADMIGQAQPEELSFALERSCHFLDDLLMPHMEAAEKVVYPELERLFQNRHSMTPMRREHDQIRAHIRDIDQMRVKAAEKQLSLTQQMRLRRAMFTLYALIKIHLAEELLYSEIIEAGATPEKEEALAAAMSHEGISAL